MDTMTQCVFVKGPTQQTLWIESRGAKKGAEVELGKNTGDFWKVMFVGTTLPKQAVLKKEGQSRRGVFGSIK